MSTVIKPVHSPSFVRMLRSDVANLSGLVRRCHPAVLFVPAVVAASVALSVYSPWHSLAQKDFQEVLAPTLLAVGLAAAAGLRLRHSSTFLTWQLLLTAALFCRELHFAGTNNAIYVALWLLVWFLSRKTAQMEPYSANRWIVTLFFGALWAYVAAKTFDRGYWRLLFPSVEVIRDAMEETLESTGHALIVAMVAVSAAVAARRASGSEKTRSRCRVSAPRVWLAALLVTAGLAGAVAAVVRSGESPDPVRSPGALPFELSSVCPVVPPIADGPLYLASSDEHRTISLWDFDENDSPRLVQDLTLEVILPDGRLCYLDDIEALASDGRGRYWAVTSHRQFSAEKERKRFARSQGTECALVQFRLVEDAGGTTGIEAHPVCLDLLHRVRRLGVFETVNWQYSKTFRWRRLAKSWQIDVEGLAYHRGQLLLGFKNPVEEERATVLAFDLKTRDLSVAARPNLHGHGILSLDAVTAPDRLYLVSNDPQKGRFARSSLWIGRRTSAGQWQFDAAPNLVLDNGTASRKASGIAAIGHRLLVCFDDPQKPILKWIDHERLAVRPVDAVSKRQ